MGVIKLIIVKQRDVTDTYTTIIVSLRALNKVPLNSTNPGQISMLTKMVDQNTALSLSSHQGRSDGGYIGIYNPPNQSTLIFFVWLFCLLARSS